MKRRRISDRDVRNQLDCWSDPLDECLRDLLRCRRALREIHRIAEEESGYIGLGIANIAAEALGKGEKA